MGVYQVHVRDSGEDLGEWKGESVEEVARQVAEQTPIDIESITIVIVPARPRWVSRGSC